MADPSHIKRKGQGADNPGHFAHHERAQVAVAIEKDDAWGDVVGPNSVDQWKAAGFTPELATEWSHQTLFSPSEAKRWLDAGCGPVEADQWAAHLFTPDLALEWKEAGIGLEEASRWAAISSIGYDESVSRKWRECGFSPERAMRWRKADFEPKAALAWEQQKFDIDEAQLWRDNGFSSAKLAAEWRGYGFSAISADRWAENFTAKEASKWVDCGFNDPDTKFVLAWRAIGVEPGEAGTLAFQGYTPKDYAEKMGIDPGLFAKTPARSFRNQAADWHAAGVSPLMARQWVALQFSIPAALAWQATNVTPTDAAEIRSRLTGEE